MNKSSVALASSRAMVATGVASVIRAGPALSKAFCSTSFRLSCSVQPATLTVLSGKNLMPVIIMPVMSVSMSAG